MKKIIPVLTIVAVLAFFGSAGAIMGGSSMMPGVGGTGTIGAGAMMGGGFAMTNTGGFGMMNGMAGAPVVGSDGTAYLISYNPSANPGTVPGSNSFESTITAVTPSGAVSSITLNGIVSRPVVKGNALVATASLPNFSNYHVFQNFGTAAPAGQSMAYVVTLPLTSSSVPVGVSLDGQFASTPVIENNNAYVVTSDFGNGMMTGNSTFNMMYGNYNFNNTGTAHSYLYIIGLDGSLVNKITLQ
ncbi:MAG: hypothetical protein M0Z71_11080 [Nitrospiraceae bacterium]|nr:hypothetical protein [Nitrospiraceae bacterium]